MIDRQPLLTTRGLTKSFSTVTVLHDVDLEIYPGEILALLGENGAGKSTLMKIIAGIYKADRGEVLLADTAVHFNSPREAQNAGISMIHQELNLLPNRTVAQNIYVGREPHLPGLFGRLGQVDTARMNREAAEMLTQVRAPVMVTRRLSMLSTGQRQQVEIAKALATNAKILLMDEPTSSLSEEQATILIDLIRELRDRGLGIVFTTHRLPEAFKIAERFVVLRDGFRVANVPATETSPEQVIQWMVGRPLNQLFPKPDLTIGEPILNVRGLSGGMVQDVSFDLHRGEILGFAGLVGAGRTETARLLFGADKATGGEITLDGKRVEIGSPAGAVSAGIGLVPEDRKLQSLIVKLAVRHNMVLAALPNLSKRGAIQLRAVDQEVNRYIELLRVRLRSPRQQVRFLSGGNQQKVVLAKWLMIKPKVLILDEPTRGIDVGAKAEIYQLIGELARSGIGVILISSEMPELLALSDRIVVMAEGKVMATLGRAEATQENIMTYASVGHEVIGKEATA